MSGYLQMMRFAFVLMFVFHNHIMPSSAWLLTTS